MVRHMVRNLFVNARLHGGNGAIRAEVRQLEAQAIIAVEDDGPGVPESERSVSSRLSTGRPGCGFQATPAWGWAWRWSARWPATMGATWCTSPASPRAVVSR